MGRKSSGSSCSAIGCNPRAGTNALSEVRMIKFPRDPERRLQWEAAVNRKDWKPDNNSVLCYKHFVFGEQSDDPYNIDYVPSGFSHKLQSSNVQEDIKIARYQRSKKRKIMSGMDHESSEQEEPKTLKCLVSEVKYAGGNCLIHQFAMNYSKSDGRYIRAVLLSLSSDTVNARNEDGFTALHLAVRKRNYFMVRAMLTYASGIDVNAKSSSGETALHMASWSTRGVDVPTIVEMLVHFGANLQARDNRDKSPLHVFVENNDWESIKVIKKLLGLEGI